MTQNATTSTYDPPAVIFEAALEVRAGTPLSLPDAVDLLGGGQ